MAIVAHVSGVALGPLIFMIILLMLGFVKHINPERHLIFYSRLTPLFQIVKGMIYQFSKHKTKKVCSNVTKTKEKTVFKYLITISNILKNDNHIILSELTNSCVEM